MRRNQTMKKNKNNPQSAIRGKCWLCGNDEFNESECNESEIEICLGCATVLWNLNNLALCSDPLFSN